MAVLMDFIALFTIGLFLLVMDKKKLFFKSPPLSLKINLFKFNIFLIKRHR